MCLVGLVCGVGQQLDYGELEVMRRGKDIC